jgi:hypothetical protein
MPLSFEENGALVPILDSEVTAVQVVGSMQELPPQWGPSRKKTVESYPLGRHSEFGSPPRVLLTVPSSDSSPEATVAAKPKRRKK